MAFQSQFSLSLELTRLIPMSLAVAGKTYEAAMSLARDLQSSGADIVVADDLAELFGRSRIAAQMASTFRTVVSKSNPPQKLCEGIALCDGPGPTVIRALTQDTYFSMVLQCSFLVSVHENYSLAAAIAYHFEKRAQEAPEGRAIRAAPSLEGIRGVLRTCEDQTAAFDWQKILLAVGTTLGLTETNIFDSMPPVIFRGLISMLPLVQHFPEERLIYLETNQGVCSIVTWAHNILGLSVLVRLDQDGQDVEYRFGSSETIIIDVRTHMPRLSATDVVRPTRDPSITLLSSSDKERLFTMTVETDEETIDATFKRPACRYGSRIFNKDIPLREGREKVATEMAVVTTAFATCIAKALYIKGYDFELEEYDSASSSEAHLSSVDIEDDANEFNPLSPNLRYDVSERRIYEAACLLFGDRALKKTRVDEYVAKYSGRQLSGLPVPETIIAIIQDWPGESKDGTGLWPMLCRDAIQLSVLVLAFAHVSDLPAGSDLPLCEHYHKTNLSRQIEWWDGSRPIQIEIESDPWFEIIVMLMIGHTADTSLRTTSLISARGWSVFLSTFGDADPIYIDRGFVAIKKGVPCRNGVWKHRVVDCSYPRTIIRPETDQWRLEAKPGESAALSCISPVEYGTPLVGERGDSFVVSLRLQRACDSDSSNKIRRTGYKELAHALWRTQRSKSCSHHPRLGETVVLEPGMAAVSGSSDTSHIKSNGDVVICLTACNLAARWRVLLSLATFRGERSSLVMLRGSDCCFKCVIQQTLKRAGPSDTWAIIL